MVLTAEALFALQRDYPFTARALEKTIRSLSLLEAINHHAALRGQFILRGGTALHMFYLDAQRLSVDIDLIYGGSKEPRTVDRIADALQEIMKRTAFYALPKGEFRRQEFMLWEVVYHCAAPDAPSRIDTLRVDIDFQSEVLQHQPVLRSSYPLGPYQARDILVADSYDVCVGKLEALQGRSEARDLYDAYLLSAWPDWDFDRLQRTYLGVHVIRERDPRWIKPKGLFADINDLRENLLPLLKAGTCENTPRALYAFGDALAHQARMFLDRVRTLAPDQEAWLNDALARQRREP